MNKNSGIKKLWLLLLVVPIVGLGLWFAAPAQAATTESRCNNFSDLFKINSGDLTSGNQNVDTTPITSEIPKICSAGDLLYGVMNLLLIFAGSIAVVFIILGGFWYMTAAGNAEQAEKGQKALTNAVIGLVVVILAGTIVRIVANTLGGNLGSGGTDTTQNPGTGGTGDTGGTGGTGTTESLASIVDIQRDKEVIVATEAISFTASFPASQLAAVQQRCGSNTPEFNVVFGSGPSKSGVFSRTGNDYFASVTFLPNTFAAGANTIAYSVCNASWTPINVTVAGTLVPYSDYTTCLSQLGDPNTCCEYFPQEPTCQSSSPAQQAAGRSSFTAEMSGSNLSVNINAQTSDRMFMCDTGLSNQLINKPMEVLVNGAVAAQAAASDSFVNVPAAKLPAGNFSVSVKICGYAIGSAKTVSR